MQHYFSRLESAMNRHWDKDALCNYNGEHFTFGDLATSIGKFHILFENIGVRKGDRIAICARNSAKWAVSFLSVSSYEAVAVPILSDFLPDAVTNLTAHSGSVVLFTDRDMWEHMDKSNLPAIKAVVNITDFTLLFAAGDSISAAFAAIDSDFKARYPMGFGRDCVKYPTDNGKDLSVINYTSGTTSAPKGVMLRYECFNATLKYADENLYTDHNDTVVSMLPMGHIYGLVFEFLFPLCHGATVYFFGKTPSPTLLLKAMKDVRPFMVVSVPLVMEKIYKTAIKPAISKWYMKVLLHTPGISCLLYGKIRKKIMASFGGRVRVFIMGGAALNPEVEKCFKRMHLPFTVGYGMTEATPLLAYESWDKFVPGSCGKPISCTEIRIDSEDPQHIAGEIQARGTNICSGYYKNEEANTMAFSEDGFLRTGDLGIIDKDGNIFIKGRIKNMILSANGQNIYPEEVEAVINAQDFVAESVVVDRASKLVALVYLDKDAITKGRLDAERVADIPETVKINANRSLPPYSQIAKVEIVLNPFEKTPKLSIKRFLYSNYSGAPVIANRP